MKAISVSMLMLAALAPLHSGAAPISLSKRVQVEPISTVPTEELWSTTVSKTVTTGNVVVEQLGIDVESGSLRGKFQACALILIGTVDLGVKPVALRLWASVPCDASVSGMAPSNTPGEAKFKLRIDERTTFTIHVTGDEKVTISGVPVGSISH